LQPGIKQDLVLEFDNLVKQKTSAEVFNRYREYCQKHMNNELTVKQYRQKLDQLFRPFSEIMHMLPVFFSPEGDLSISKSEMNA
jgi:hypothetical protein